ncbi:hypothetical protein DX932_02415 [Bacillus cereus]|uniref:Uncharacterized protein n=1 Tax=Bacillus cereus TaxID=1396 RepID=A0A9W7Q8B1_BACCE|nr:hypothetical protein DX932_02415 [Bacillus cereus]
MYILKQAKMYMFILTFTPPFFINLNMIIGYESFYLSRYLPGSKIPTSKFSGSKDVRWGINCP